jgi:hypothetical protein
MNNSHHKLDIGRSILQSDAGQTTKFTPEQRSRPGRLQRYLPGPPGVLIGRDAGGGFAPAGIGMLRELRGMLPLATSASDSGFVMAGIGILSELRGMAPSTEKPSRSSGASLCLCGLSAVISVSL